MPDRQSHPFTISSQHRSDLGVALLPGHTVVATLAFAPRAQMTPEEITYLGSGELRHQWGLGIGPDPCNKLYVMHRAVQGSFENARLVIGFKTNIGKTTSDECHNCGYGPTTTTYSGAELGVIVVSRSNDGQTLSVRAYDLLGVNLLTTEYHATVPEHWEGDCSISLRGDNCFASGVMTT